MTSSSIILFSLEGLAILVGISFVFIWFRRKKEKGFLTRGMSLALFLVTLPRERRKEEKVSLKEYLKTASQFYSSLSGIKEKKKIKSFLLGAPVFVFEISVHRIGEEIHFYVASPRGLAEMVEKQILGFWPKAQVQEVSDYNIFNPEGVSLASEATLKKPSLLPIKTYQNFEADPLSSITSVMTKLEKEGEGAAIQVLIRPTKKKLAKKGEKVIASMKKGLKLKEALVESGGGIFKEVTKTLSQETKKEDKEQEELQKFEKVSPRKKVISAISEKTSQSLFDVNLRVLASGKNKSRSQSIIGQLEGAFEQFGSPVLNKIKFKRLSGKKLKKIFYRFSFRIFNERKTMVLSTGEIASILHFPSPALLTPHIKWLKAKQAPTPDNLPEKGLVIGKNIFRGQERKVRILKKDRARHFYIIGQTGTGKSALIQEMIRQDVEAGKGVALIDPHGDLAEDVLGVIPSSRAEDVIYLNPSDIERPLGLNMLEVDERYPESKSFVVNEILEIFEKLYNLKAHGFGGPIFEQYMRNALLLVMDDPKTGNTLIEIPRVLADKEFRKHKLSRCKNIVVKNFWEKEAEKAKGEAALANMVPYITSKMNVFIANDLVRPIISQPHSSFNFRDIMDKGKILIINLSKGKIGEINSYLLGMIVVGKILIAALSRADIPEQKRRNFYLYIDEFHNVTTKTISEALAEARKYRLNMIFAHQFIGQLDEDTQKAIFGNVGSILSFRVGPDDAKYLVSQFEPIFDENNLVNFDNYNAALRLLIRGETSDPFNIVTYPPKTSNQKVASLIKRLSRTKYGRDKNIVEANLQQRLKKSYGVKPI